MDSVEIVPTDDQPRTTWRNFLGPVILTARRRLWNKVLLSAWIVAAVVLGAAGRFDILWLPLVGVVTSSVLFFRDRAGQRRSV
jgi:hypothetical protein